MALYKCIFIYFIYFNKKLHSCETLNVMFTDKALESMDAKKVKLVVLLDLSKAFDSIDHATLLAKLQALGVSRASLDWFKSYLSERPQCVRIGAETSSLKGISHGVPRGSILGPALFTIYFNSIPSIPGVCSLESYVDDSKLYLSFPVAEASNMIRQINKDLEKNCKLVLLQQPSHKPRETQAAGVRHTSDASEAAR